MAGKEQEKKFLRFEGMTPKSFFDTHVNLNLKDFICLINCPMSDKSYEKVYTVDYLGNVIEGNPIRYLNVDSDTMKKSNDQISAKR